MFRTPDEVQSMAVSSSGVSDEQLAALPGRHESDLLSRASDDDD
jgi:hypothetical protein